MLKSLSLYFEIYYKFIDELTMASYESEIDLDRDMPGDEAFLEFNNMVDEDEVDVITDHIDSFDDYLDAHPDFNAALNGHPDWI